MENSSTCTGMSPIQQMPVCPQQWIDPELEPSSIRPFPGAATLKKGM